MLTLYPKTNSLHRAAGIFDPLGFSKGNLEELKLKEIKNGAPLQHPQRRPMHAVPWHVTRCERRLCGRLVQPTHKEVRAQAASPCSASPASWCVRKRH